MKANLLASLTLFAALGVASTFTRAQVAPPARSAPSFTLYFENDYFGGSDRYYTNGLKLSWLSGDLNGWGQEGWRQRFLEALPFVNLEGAQKNFGFALGQNIYTPKNTDLVVPDPLDRPYAGWTYAELSFISKTESRMDTIALQIGMVGRHSYAQDTQRIFHEWINDGRPNGWEYQIKDEIGVNIITERKWRLYGRALGEHLGVDLVPHVGLSLGNVQTYANAGFTTRLGINLPSDFGVGLIRGGGATNSPIDENDPRLTGRRWSFFIFGGADGRAVARDIFLDGNTFKDSPSVDKEPFVADIYYGAGATMGKWQLTYTEVLRTKEFKRQDRENYFGSVTLSRVF